MSIYLGYPPHNARKNAKVGISLHLKKKGIELLRANPSNVPIVTIPAIDTPGWTSFIGNLPAFIQSTATLAPVHLGMVGYPITKVHAQPIPVQFPALCIGVGNTSPEIHNNLLTLGFEDQSIRGTTTYLIADTTKEVLRAISSDSGMKINEKIYAPFGYANLAAVRTFNECVQLLSYTLSLLKKTDIAGRATEAMFILDATLDNAEDEDAQGDVPMSKGATTSPLEKLAAASELKDMFSPAELSFPNEPIEADAADIRSLAYRPFNNITDTAKIYPGVVVKYEPELAEFDKTGVVDFIKKYLLRSLGASMNDIVEKLDEMRSAWGVLAMTESGHILSHLVVCMEMGIRAHAKVDPIFLDGYYEGCVIFGHNFMTSVNQTVYHPLEPAKLGPLLTSLDSHSRAVQEIIGLLRKGGVAEDSLANGLKEMETLRILLRRANLNENDKDKIRETAAKLRYPIRKWNVNLGSLREMMSIIKGGLDEIPVNTPIGPRALFSNDIVEIVMSCFRDGSAPSFRHPSGTPINLRAEKAPTPPVGNARQGNRRNDKGPVNNGGWVFTVRRVEFDEAVADFRIMMKEGEARSLGTAAARGVGYLVLQGANFTTMFGLLKDCLAQFSSSDKVHLPSTEVEEGISNKRVASSPAGPESKKRLRFDF
jgi:hypothetical protein